MTVWPGSEAPTTDPRDPAYPDGPDVPDLADVIDPPSSRPRAVAPPWWRDPWEDYPAASCRDCGGLEHHTRTCPRLARG